jgi:hypothetical protein
MIGRSIGALLVVGSGLALVACGGKPKGYQVQGGAGNGGLGDPSGGNTPPGGYQTPPPTYETPPPTYETPPPGYENPGGAGTEACTQICNAYVNRTCGGQVITAQMMAECPVECRALITESEPCGAEYGALLSCMFRTEFFQDLLDAACAGEEIELDEEDAEELLIECGQHFEAFEACSGPTEPNPEEPNPPGQRCDPEGDQCAGCIEACESCQCSLGAASEQCVTICNPPV